MDLLAFARGPALAVALAVFVLGVAWRLQALWRHPSPVLLSQPRTSHTARGAARWILARMWQPRIFRGRTLVATLAGYAYHVGLAIVAFGFVPHIAFVKRLTGLAWPALPGPMVAAGVALAFAGLGYALLARLTSPVLRLISGFDDYATWVVTMLPLVTGMGVLRLDLAAPYPATPDLPLALALHLFAFELLLVWLPFSKLSHAFLVFFSRGTTGAGFARKGIAP